MEYKVKGQIKHRGFAKRAETTDSVSFGVDASNIDIAIEDAKAQLATRYRHSQHYGGWITVYRLENGKFVEEKRVALGGSLKTADLGL